MCFALSNKDVEEALDCVRVMTKRQPKATLEGCVRPEAIEVDTTVVLPVLAPSGTAVPLFPCTVFRALTAYTGWHAVFSPPSDDAPARVVTSAADGDGNRAVVARSTREKWAGVEPSEGEVTTIAGFGLIEQSYALAESTELLGVSFDPSPGRQTILGDPYESSMLEFFSRVAKVEAALSDWGVLSRALAETGEGPDNMPETVVKERLLTSATQILERTRHYWILKTSDPEGRDVAIQSEGWLFLFTSPDVAARHALDAKDANPDVPHMEPHYFPTNLVRDHATQPQLAGVWFNPPATPPPNATLAGNKFSNDQLKEWYALVDQFGKHLTPGW